MYTPELITARDADDRLSEPELVALTQQMLFAGHEPTMNLIGNGVIIGIASANRDPRQFPDPDQLVVTRTARHLAFGHGVHRCVGAALARAEGRIAIGTLLRRYPSLRLAVPLDELDWLPFPVFRDVSALPVSAT